MIKSIVSMFFVATSIGLSVGIGSVSGASIYVSVGETTGGNTLAQRTYADTFDNLWRNGFDPVVNTDNFNFQTYFFPTVGPLNTINGGSPYLDMPMGECYSPNFKVTVSLRNTTGSDLRGIVEPNTASAPSISSSTTLQDNAVKPQSLVSANLRTEAGFGAGDDDSRNAILYEFSEPVYGFGVWIGDVETRNDGNGVLAQIRLLDGSGNLITSGGIISSLTGGLNSSGIWVNCGGDNPNQSPSACGNETTRFVGFSDLSKQVKYMMIIVGDDDDSIDGGSIDGGDEHLSFIGPTVACPMTELKLSKSATPSIAQSGDVINYTINFENTLYGTAYQSQITDLRPTSYLNYLTSSIVVNQVALVVNPIRSGSYLIRSGLDIGGQQTGQIVITGQVNDNASTVSGWLNIATIWTSGEFNTGNNIGTAWIESLPYDLSIAKSVDQSVIQSGGILTYTIQYHLSGARKSNIIVEDNLPVGVQFKDLVSANPTVSYSTGTPLIFSGINLEGGQTGVIVFEALVTTGLSGAILVNTANIGLLSGTDRVIAGETQTGNNTSTASTTLISLNTLAGVVYIDTNYNSGYNGSDRGLDNIVVGLYSGTTLIATGLTSSTGYYFFSDLPDGVYTVSYINSSSYVPYISNTGTINGVSMGISSGTMTLNSISLINGVNSINNNFGLIDANYDLALQKYVDLTTATIGDQVTYTIKYMNYGPASVDNVIIQDIFPDDVLMLDSTDPVYNTQDGNLYAWNIGTLGANQSGSIILTATVIDAISGGELVINTGIIGQGNLTGVLSFDGETNTGNNISNTSGDTQIYDLALTKTTSQDTSVSGQTITFTLTIFNQGSVDASGIQLIDYIPDGLILDDTDWNLSGSSAIYIVDGVLPAGSSTTVDITLKTTGLTGVITNRAEIIADNGEDIDSMTDTTNNTTIESPLDDEINNASNDEDDHDGVQITVFDEPVYRIHKTLLTPNARPGDLVTYRIDYEMIYQTPSVYFDIVIKDILSTGLIFSGFTQHYDARLASHPGSLPGAGETGMFDLGGSSVYYYTLGNGFITGGYNSGYVMVQAIVDSDLTCMSTITNRAGYSGPDGYEFDPANRWVQDETSYTIPCLSDVWVEKNPIAGTYVSGDYVSWYITYGNNGPDTASNVILTEHGGIGNTYISGHTYSIGILTAGQTGSLIVSGVVRGLGGDNVDNTISITTHTPEINTGNNKDRASITLGSIVIPPRPLNTIAGVIYRDINSNSGYNIGIDNPINNVVIGVYSGGILIVTGLTSSTGYYFFHDLPDGTYSLLYNNTTSYIPYSSNIGTINGIPMGSTSGVMSLINIRLAGGVNSISNNFGLVYTSTSSSSNGGAYIPVVLTSAIIVPAPQTISTPTHASADETITLDDFIAQIPKTQTPTETVSVESVKLMPRTGARSKR